MELHDRLKKARIDAGFSVKAVAAKLDKTRVQIWRMEKNADFISIERLRALADLYGVSVHSLFADNLELGADEVPFQLIGMAVEAVEEVACTLETRPSPEHLKNAVIAVARYQHEQWLDDITKTFEKTEYKVMIEQHLRANKPT